MVKRQLGIGAVMLWLIAQGGFAWAETITSSEYFPLEDGSFWTYRVTDAYGAYTVTQTVLPGTELVNGIGTKVISGNWGDLAYYTSDQDGIRLHGFHFVPDDYVYMMPPLVQARGTMQIPETVESTGVAQFVLGSLGVYYLNYTTTFTLQGKETVTVPAGTFETLRVIYYLRLFGQVLGTPFDETTTGTSWYARYVGNVKESYVDEEGTTTHELISTNVTPPVDARPIYLPFLPLLLD